MKKILTVILIAWATATCSVPAAQAQTDAQLSQYWAVPTFYNPGATGQTDFVRLRGGSRLQWIGIDHAPTAFLLTADMPFKLGKHRLGAGLIMQQESIGLYKNITLDAQISYKLKLFGGTLSPAIQIGFLNETFNGQGVKLPDSDDYHEGADDAIPTQNLSGSSLDLGAGVWYEHKLFRAGLSLLHANSPKITFSSESGEGANEKNYEFTAGRTLYFTAESNIPVKNTLFEVIPSVFVKTDFTFYTAEAMARLRFRKLLSMGVGYRYNDAVTVSVAADYRNFFFGYCYDYPVSNIAKASSGSHEIIAGYSLKLDLSERNKNRHKSIRIM